MVVTESGIVTDSKLFPKNASSPILVTEFGIVTAVNPIFLNTSLRILVTGVVPLRAGMVIAIPVQLVLQPVTMPGSVPSKLNVPVYSAA